MSASPASILQRPWLLSLALAAAVVISFWPATNNGWVSLDDPIYVVDNPQVQAGWTATGLEWAWTTFTAGNWHPLTWLSHMLDVAIWGAEATGPHAVNIGLHVVNSVLLFVWLALLTNAPRRSFFLSLIFAIHPLRVESVAWVSERKDLLASLGFIIALLAYYAYDRRRSAVRMAGVWLAMAVSLLAKPMAVTLPFVLLLLDLRPAGFLRSAPRTALIEKLPLMALSLAASIMAVVSQRAVGAMHSLESLSMGDRIGQSLLSYAGYLIKTLVPTDLGVLYPHLSVVLTSHEWWTRAALSAAGLLALGIMAWRWRHRAPFLGIGLAWFLGTLVPVIGLVQVGNQSMADRYTYLPSIGLALMGIGISRIWSTWPRLPVGGLAAGLAIGCGFLTAAQCRTWYDSESLFRHATEVSPQNYAARTELAGVLLQRRQLGEARELLQQSLAIHPHQAMAHFNLGLLAGMTNDAPTAISHLQRSTELQPHAPQPWTGLGDALRGAGDAANAIEAYREATRLDPTFRPARSKLALAHADAGDFDASISILRRLIDESPGDEDAHYNLAGIAARAGDDQLAGVHYDRVLQLDPARTRARFHLAGVLQRASRWAAAEQHLDRCLQEQPGVPDIHVRRARVRVARGATPGAIADFQNALRLDSNHVRALHGLAWIRATSAEAAHRDCHEAQTLAARAVEVSSNLDTQAALAAAAAECGDFATAARIQRELVEAFPGDAALQRRWELYRAGKPYRAH